MSEIKTENLSKVIKDLLNVLPDRYQDIVEKRYGLKKDINRHTLESIGQEYGITRERIRQIENAAKGIILKSDLISQDAQGIINNLEKIINNHGGVAPESDILNKFKKKFGEGNENVTDDYIHFLLQLADSFKLKNSREFRDKIWFTNEDNFNAFKASLDHLYKDLSTDEILTEKEIIDKFTKKMKEFTNDRRLLKLEVVKNLISLSRKIGSNEIGHWGLANSRHIRLKGVKDYAFLVLKDIGKPLHFEDISKEIKKRFGREVNTATTHNELIKDDRFILVGRGLYGLKEWGVYSGGTVSDVIKTYLKEHGPAIKDDIIEYVLSKKDVKPQTIVINLSKRIFKKLDNGKYDIIRRKKRKTKK